MTQDLATQEDAKSLQAHLNKITDWAMEDDMNFNKDKLELIR